MKKLITCLALMMLFTSAKAQIGIGMTTGLDFYQWYDKGDKEDLLESSSSGSVLANIILGPKIWIGGPDFSVSLEAPINWGIFHFDVNEFKGIGAIAFPLGAKMNFGAATGFTNASLVGFSLGGGLQYMNTEIYTTKSEFKDKMETGYFRTYYGEAAVAFGFAGFNSSLYVRYGRGEADEQNVNVGMVVNFNLTNLMKMSKSFEDQPDPFEGGEETSYAE